VFERLDNLTEQEWLEIRQKVLTASDIGVILGLNPWKTVKELIESKANIQILDNSYMWLGRQLESLVVECTNKVLNSSFELFNYKAFFVDRNIGLGATPDAGDKKVLLECKSTRPSNALKWGNLPPLYYLTQLYTQMICCNRNTGYLSILSTNLTQRNSELYLPISVHKIERDLKLDNIILEEVRRFWNCKSVNKQYRVDRKQTSMLELKLRAMVNKIY